MEERLLVVDDEEQMRKALFTALDRKGYDVVTVASGDEALKRLAKEEFNAVITDVKMPKMSGVELLRSVKEREPALPVLIMTAYGTIENAIEAIREGAEDYILKPFSSEVIERALSKALRVARDGEEHGILTRNPAMLDILEVAANIAPTTATVLITGESGTGKEMLARFIHTASDRSDGPFVSVNCAAIPDGLLESELFGHEKGAFTGAHTRRIGRFEQADEGTLLLDEVGDMGLMLQTKLLRVLQEREVDRVGGNEPVKVDIRVIATTNRDLKRDVSEKLFREDLFYRLNVFPFTLPPLSERPEDIEYLAEHFMTYFSKRYDRRVTSIGTKALDALKDNPWRGNIRELQNVMERAVLLSPGDEISPKELYYGGELPPESVLTARGPGSIGTIRDMEKELILRVVNEAGTNKTEAAKKLGISVRTLRNKLNEYEGEEE